MIDLIKFERNLIFCQNVWENEDEEDEEEPVVSSNRIVTDPGRLSKQQLQFDKVRMLCFSFFFVYFSINHFIFYPKILKRNLAKYTSNKFKHHFPSIFEAYYEWLKRVLSETVDNFITLEWLDL